MNVLFLSHCVPNPPDKGEKIRAHHEVRYLAERCRLHVACLARSEAEREAARELERCCASVRAEPLHAAGALAAGAARFALGGSLLLGHYDSRRLREHGAGLSPDVVVAYSAALAPLAPAGPPMVLDMVDVDSEKWLQYGRERRPGFLYAMEGRRLRRYESEYARAAACTFLSTGAELALFRQFEPEAKAECLENGVDLDYFDPAAVAPLGEAAGKRVLVFTGAMDYYPNSDGACRFAREVFPRLRARDPELEFWVVGRNPVASVRALASEPGVRVTGSVPDIRPYLRSAWAVVTPLRIARGIQNKVLEALAMDKRVLASGAVCRTFGGSLPEGVELCETPEQFGAALRAAAGSGIREAARRRFCWEDNLEKLWQAVVAAGVRRDGSSA